MYNEPDEQDLIVLCAKGDKKAKGELYNRYAARLFTLCRRYSSNREDAKDLLQEVFIRAFDKLSSFSYSGKGSFFAWISRIAINMARSRIRKWRWKFVSVGPEVEDLLPNPTLEEMARIPEEKLLDLIAALPEMRRVVFNLYCIDGYSHKEIGKMLGISEKGAASTLAKARRQLKEAIRIYLNAEQ